MKSLEPDEAFIRFFAWPSGAYPFTSGEDGEGEGEILASLVICIMPVVFLFA